MKLSHEHRYHTHFNHFATTTTSSSQSDHQFCAYEGLSRSRALAIPLANDSAVPLRSALALSTTAARGEETAFTAFAPSAAAADETTPGTATDG